MASVEGMVTVEEQGGMASVEGIASVEEVFPPSSPTVASVANFLEHVLSALKLFDKPEERLQQFMPEPLKTEESLRRVCALATSDLSSRNLLEQYMKLAALEKSPKHPALQLFLSKRAAIARYFLQVPMLAKLASPVSTAWKRLNGYKDEQSWLYLEYSEPRVRNWIHEQMPCCASHRTNQVARWMDDIDRMARASEFRWGACTLEDVKATGLWNQEWVGDDPLALVALDLITAQKMKISPLRIFRTPIDDDWISDTSDSDTDTTTHGGWPTQPIPSQQTTSQRCLVEEKAGRACQGGSPVDREWQWPLHKCLRPFKSLKERHESLRFASIRLICLKLLDNYIQPPYEFSEDLQQTLKPFQSRCRLNILRHFLECSVKHIVTERSHGLDEHIEDLLEDARALLDCGQVCDCCASSFKAIVESSRVYAFPLAKRRLCHLAKCVLLKWKKPDFNKLWIDMPQPPFPAPILDEIENCWWPYTRPDKSLLIQSLPSFQYIVSQYRKVKEQGLVSKHEDYKDLVVKCAVQVLDMVEAQLSKKGEGDEYSEATVKELTTEEALESRHEAKVKELTSECERRMEELTSSVLSRIKVLDERFTAFQESHAQSERVTRELTELQMVKNARAEATLQTVKEEAVTTTSSSQVTEQEPQSFQASTSSSKRKVSKRRVATWLNAKVKQGVKMLH